jgi:hypothetical protein
MDTRRETNHASRTRAKDPRGRVGLAWVTGLVTAIVAAGALSGCATMLVDSSLGPPETGMPEAVLRYDWAGRRGDEVVVAYTVRADRAEEKRWVAVDLGQLAGTPAGALVGVLRPMSATRPDPASMEPVAIVPLVNGPDGANTGALTRAAENHLPAIGAQVGYWPEITVVTVDPAVPNRLRYTTWRIPLGRAPAPLEPVGRGRSRAILVPVALAVDLMTAPLQLVLFSFVGMH